MNWTDEQLKIVLKTIIEADDGCGYCVWHCFEVFLKQNNRSILPQIERIWKSEPDIYKYFEWECIERHLKEVE